MGSAPSGHGRGPNSPKLTPFMSADELVSILEEGDLIEFDRCLYKHWGVYVECADGVYYIVHLSGDLSEQSMAKFSGQGDTKLGNSLGASLQLNGEVAIVQKADLKLVANGQLCRVNNLRDVEFRPYSPSTVIARATSEIGKQKYNALSTNCEHFSTWCRYGTKSSNQASSVKMLATGLVVGVATSSAVYGALGSAGYFVASRIGRRIIHGFTRGALGW